MNANVCIDHVSSLQLQARQKTCLLALKHDIIKTYCIYMRSKNRRYQNKLSSNL